MLSVDGLVELPSDLFSSSLDDLTTLLSLEGDEESLIISSSISFTVLNMLLFSSLSVFEFYVDHVL